MSCIITALSENEQQLLTRSLICASVGVVVAVSYLQCIQSIKRRKRHRELDQWIEDAREDRSRKQFRVLLDMKPTDSASTILSANATAQQILGGKLSMLQNIVNLCHRCRQYGRNEEVNAITQELYDTAYEQGKELLKNPVHVRTQAALYGVPVCVKDRFAIKGYLQTGGMACRLKSPATEDSLIIQLLKTAGAIPICMSNTVQAMSLPESKNRIWGRTSNPWDLSRTPGGSSGGDAALVAMGCVPLAIASDLGGSIRMPAAFCGVVGFKPTSTRLSVRGNMTARKNNRIAGTASLLPTSIGPITRNVDDAVLFMKAVCVPTMWNIDKNIPPLPFDDKLYNSIANNAKPRRLKIGYFVTDGFFQPCTAAIRGLQETIEGLSRTGHNCVKFMPPTDGWTNYGLLLRIASAEGSLRSIKEALEGEPMLPEFRTILLGISMPDVVRWFLRLLLDTRRSFMLGCSRRNGISVYDAWQLFADVIEVRNQWSSAIANSGCDVVIFPTLPLPAMPHGTAPKVSAAFTSLFVANLLQWPAGTVPVTTIRDNEQNYYHASDSGKHPAGREHGTEDECSLLLAEDGRGRQSHKEEINESTKDALPEVQRDKFAVMADSIVMKNSAGLPISVSVMAPAFKDELCLGALKEVERAVNFAALPTAYRSSRQAA